MNDEVSRRRFIQGLAVGTAGIVGGVSLAACSPQTTQVDSGSTAPSAEGEVSIEVSETFDCDMVVVGAGISGLAASVEASDLGLDVIQLEKQPSAGGWGIGTEGVMFVGSKLQKDLDIQIELADIVANEVDYTHNRIDALRWADIVANSAENYDWAVSKGVTFSGVVDDYRGAGNGLAIFHWFETGTARESYSAPMIAAAESQGVRLMTSTQGYKLKMDGGKVSGIYAKNEGGADILITCKAVIIATGGVASNRDYMKHGLYNMNRMMNVYEGMDGDGLAMALEVGGVDATANVSALEVLTAGDICSGTYATYTRNGIDFASTLPNTMWVNEYGERFHSENVGSDNWMAILTPTKFQNRCFTIFDQAIIDENMGTHYADDQESLEKYTSEYMAMIEDSARDGVQAESIDELCNLAVEKYDCLDKATLKKSIEDYNALCATGIDVSFNKPVEAMVAIENGPFYLIELNQTACVAFGGITTSRHFEVVDENREPIPGLYAIGVEGSMLWPNIYTISVPGGSNANNIHGGRNAAKNADAYISTL